MPIAHCFQAVVSQSEASVASVATERSRSLESVISQLSSMAAATQTAYGNSNKKVALVGGAVGGVLGVTVLALLSIILWKRKKGSPIPPSATQQSFLGQQPSSQPITPASPSFSTNPSYFGGPPVTHAAQAGSHSPQPTMPYGTGSPVAGQTSAASQQSAPPSHTVNTWIDRSPTIHQENYASQPRMSPSSPAEGPVDPRELYNEALRGSTYSALAPSDIPSSSGAPGSTPPPAPALPFTPPAPEKAGAGKF